MSGQECLRLIVRGDDIGAFPAVNRAMLDAYRNGIVRNTSLMVPAPCFKEAAALLKTEPGLCVGLHVTLTSEWDAPRWGPVSPPETVPSLLDRDGCFFRSCEELFAHGPDLNEMMREVQAQLDLARAQGVDIRYLDDHMAVGWVFHPPDTTRLSQKLRLLAQREKLIWYDFTEIQQVDRSSVSALILDLEALTVGMRLLILHPAAQDAEVQSLARPGTEPGQVAQDRWHDYQLALSPEIMDVISARRIALVRYDELAQGE